MKNKKQNEEPAIIAVSFEEHALYGCPYCGYRSGLAGLRQGNCVIWDCAACNNTCVLLGGGLKKSIIGLGEKTVYPELQEHPRKGIPAHGNEDNSPEMGGEFFSVRGIGTDMTPGCFICGGDSNFRNNIAAFVKTREAGARVVSMFETGARLDYRENEPDRVQVKIGACDEHKPNLEKLLLLCRGDGIITTAKIAEATK
mgnify:CR=1 FL=1